MEQEIKPSQVLLEIIAIVKKELRKQCNIVKDYKFENKEDTFMGYPIDNLVGRMEALDIIAEKGFNKYYFRSAIQNAFNYGYKSYEYYNEHAKSNYTKEEFYFVAEVFEKEIWEDER